MRNSGLSEVFEVPPAMLPFRFRQHDLILPMHNLREETGTSIAFLQHDERRNIACRFIRWRTLVCGVTDRYIALGFSRMC